MRTIIPNPPAEQRANRLLHRACTRYPACYKRPLKSGVNSADLEERDLNIRP